MNDAVLLCNKAVRLYHNTNAEDYPYTRAVQYIEEIGGFGTRLTQYTLNLFNYWYDTIEAVK